MPIVTVWVSKLRMRDQHWTLDKAPFLWLIWQPLGGRLTMKGLWLVLTEIDTSSAYKFAFPKDTASAQSIIRGLIQSLIYSHGIASGWGPPFPANECGNGPCSWIHHLTYHLFFELVFFYCHLIYFVLIIFYHFKIYFHVCTLFGSPTPTPFLTILNTGIVFWKFRDSWAPVAHACNPRYSGGRDHKVHISKHA
jgi:hypothetical protein